ncbi:hypothetical protein COU61_01870 [Candidatus Pacearchaeota archaeon CG10_big_fil_rev_8_21_14_0_10_35_13]|nr:MAG: hypothetical protein COU61_01870 [Candidatus Pacearchaeota archaeon CG10_big_fil_rev_8_21_14_0_10_35_13]
MKKVHIFGMGMVLVAVILFLILSSGNASSYESINNFGGEISIYKDSSCGCCGVYGNYFQNKGNSDTKIVSLENANSIKDKYNIPKDLRSCHTTIIGDYFVEGHIPLEAVERLLNDHPDIAGIAMPGMPEGSPGMPGNQMADFVIYSVNHDGSSEEWMRI